MTASAHTLGCGGTLHGKRGNITSPRADGSSKYPNGVECVWNVNTDPGFHIVIEFYGRFDIEMDNRCRNDYIQVNSLRNCEYYSVSTLILNLDHSSVL